MQSLQYWLGGSADNLENLLLNTCRAYVPALQGTEIEVAEPQLFLDTGIWHPLAPCELLTLCPVRDLPDSRISRAFSISACPVDQRILRAPQTALSHPSTADRCGSVAEPC